MSAAPAPRRLPDSDRRDSPPVGSATVILPLPHAHAGPVIASSRPAFLKPSSANLSWREKLTRVSYRVVEIFVASCGLVLMFPVMIVIAIIIKRDSPGPAIFRQTRIGLNGEPFQFYKFRTLYADARQRWPELYDYRYTPEEIETLVFKTDCDPRVTKVGVWLRRSTLDELPNLYNLLRGDVAMVGPRPEIYDMLPYYRPNQMLKFVVKPGLTGMAQVSGRNRLTFQETVAWDVAYVQQRTWKLDARILWETVKKVLARDGAF
jgi:lipopolysaccharide/colanic/teichoic acid biosynthesis glycosyltransferase